MVGESLRHVYLCECRCVLERREENKEKKKKLAPRLLRVLFSFTPEKSLRMTWCGGILTILSLS